MTTVIVNGACGRMGQAVLKAVQEADGLELVGAVDIKGGADTGALVGLPANEALRRARAALDKVGLLGKERYQPRMLSGGEQQRVGIARAIVNKPPLLLADEPTGNLDPQLSMDIMRLFEEFNRFGVSVLIATHDLGLIARMRYRTLTLKAGRMYSQEQEES